MSYARGTEHYNLPQTVGTDKRDWFDTNTAFENVDADLYSAKQTADNTASDVASLTTRVGTAEGDISSLATRVGTAEGDISALQGSVTGLGNDLADVKADLRDAICSVVEPDATADYAHAVDSYFWYNDTLYITTVAIAVGDTIVPNTNCNTTNVTTEIIKALTQSSSEIDDSTTALNKTWSSSKISGEIGDLAQLSTTDKTSTVNAINEVKSALLENVSSWFSPHTGVTIIRLRALLDKVNKTVEIDYSCQNSAITGSQFLLDMTIPNTYTFNRVEGFGSGYTNSGFIMLGSAGNSAGIGASIVGNNTIEEVMHQIIFLT